MIIREAPIDNAWYRAAGAWIVALLAINCLLWPLLDHYQYSLEPLWPIAVALPVGGSILWLVGKFLSEPVRVIKFVAVLGIFGIFPLFLAAALPITALIYFSHGTWLDLLIYISPCLILLAYWLFRELDNLAKKIRENKFIEREFLFRECGIFLNRSPKTDLSLHAVRSDSPLAKIGDWLIPKLVFLVPLSYPLQKLFFNTGALPAVLLLLSVISTPLAIYILVRMVCGFYLWIYTIRKLETKHKKPVMFDQS